MKILFLSTSFNSMSQRLWIELDRLNHQVKVQLDTSTEEMKKTVLEYQPELIIAPYLKSKIPASIYQKYPCMIVHPGIIGDRGASSLDWAIFRNDQEWGVTILEAVEKMDAGDIWAFVPFEMREVSKATLYRNEVAQAATEGILAAIERFSAGEMPKPKDWFKDVKKGKWNNKITQSDLGFSWNQTSQEIDRKIRAVDSDPGLLLSINDVRYYAFGSHVEPKLKGDPGEILGKAHHAICFATGDAAIWITHLREENMGIKIPAMLALKAHHDIEQIKEIPQEDVSWKEIRLEIEGDIGYIYFDFYNGAMSTEQCLRLKEIFLLARSKKLKVIVLMGGDDLWSNGIHLNVIENATNPADESWANINALNDLIKEIITATDVYVISALRGNAGAGGVSLALASDKILARDGIVFNPHTKNMGLYGSEYWTYLLPKRIGVKKAHRFTEDCLPWGVFIAKEIGLIDDFYGKTNKEFVEFVKNQAQKIADLHYYDKLLKAKKFLRIKDERNKPLQKYRDEELQKMHDNFYIDDWDYHKKRYAFIHKIPLSAIPDDLFKNRREIYRKRKWEPIEYN